MAPGTSAVTKPASSKSNKSKSKATLLNALGYKSLLTFTILALACIAGFASRLFAVIRFESIIHEFDPWYVYTLFLSAISLVKNTFFNTQVQLSCHGLHGPAWLLQLPQLVWRESLVPTWQNRGWNSLPWFDGHLRSNSLCSTCIEHPSTYQGYLCFPCSSLQVKSA